MQTFRTIIAGGREFNDYNLLKNTMDKLLSNIKDNIIIVCGKARGADNLGERYAKEKGYEIKLLPCKLGFIWETCWIYSQ